MNNHVNNDQNMNNHAHTTVSKEILAKIFADQKQRAANAAALEQTATVLEETATATAEQPAAFQSVSFAQTASNSPASVQRTISIPESAVTVNTYQGSYIGDEGSWYTDSEGFVGYYEQHYYYFTCSVDSQANGVTQTEFLEGQLRLASSNEFGGAKLFDVYSYDGEYLGSWWDAINVADTYLESTQSAEFMVVPAYGCEGAILFDKTGVTLNYTKTIVNIQLKADQTTKYYEGQWFRKSDLYVEAVCNDDFKFRLSESQFTVDTEDFEITFPESKEPRTQTIVITYENFSTTLTLTLYPALNLSYVDNEEEEEEEENFQHLDIHVPDQLIDSARVPVVITIHGGGWGKSHANKDYYGEEEPLISEFFTSNGYVNVNMEYRQLHGLGIETGANDPVPYEQMLQDIQSVIDFITTHADTYHIDPTKIALMGHSAGGHLAMLYAYKNANITPNPIKLVISEAGPTDLDNAYFVKQSIWNSTLEMLVGKTSATSDAELSALLKAASPTNYAKNNPRLPNTLLVYSENGAPWDGVLYYDQCILLKCSILGEEKAPEETSTPFTLYANDSSYYQEYKVNVHHHNFRDLFDDSIYSTGDVKYTTVLKDILSQWL